jgi:predicted nucleotidyltransferase
MHEPSALDHPTLRSYASEVPLPPTLSASETAAIREFMAAARALLGSDLRDARLFGSRARGQGHEHSDLDIALIVAAGARRRRHSLYDLAFDVGLRHGVELAPLVVEEERFQELRDRERAIAIEIDADGIPL